MDTGSDRSILPLSLIEELGFTFHALTPVSVRHPGGPGMFRQSEEDVEVTLPGWNTSFRIRPLYAAELDDEEGETSWGRDVLLYWELTLSERGRFFTLSWLL